LIPTGALSMGHYGVFVWSCYGLSVLTLVWLGIAVRLRLRSQLELAKRRAQTKPPDGG
jgi:heme exporter protein CcmD